MDDELFDCGQHCWDIVDSDGRQVCSVCGFVMPRHQDPNDCLDCGQCGDCIARSIAASEWAE